MNRVNVRNGRVIGQRKWRLSTTMFMDHHDDLPYSVYFNMWSYKMNNRAISLKFKKLKEINETLEYS